MLFEEGLILGEAKGMAPFRYAIDLISLNSDALHFLSLSALFYNSRRSGLLFTFNGKPSLLICLSVPDEFITFFG
jgi:hypothetical protein